MPDTGIRITTACLSVLPSNVANAQTCDFFFFFFPTWLFFFGMQQECFMLSQNIKKTCVLKC